MARGATVAQIQKSGPKVSVPYRASPEQVKELERVQTIEGGVTRSEVVEYLVSQGIALYFAIEEIGAARFKALGATDDRRIITEIVRRGVEVLEAEQGKKTKR